MKKGFMLMIGLAVSALLLFSAGCKKDDDDDIKELTPREKAIKDYTENYIGSFVDDPGWTGNVNGCIAGTISDDSRKKVIQRLNYFRRLVGLSDNVTENTAQHQGCQEASLIFKAQNNLSHFPPQNWKCWTQAGYDAAATGNIAWGTATSGAYCVHTSYGVSGFIEDAGANNKAVGHRAWFFMPGLTRLGIGSTNSTSTMQWKDNYSTSGPSPEFIAYPPAGYMPNQIAYPRWSFTIPTGGSFSNAQVTMTDGQGGNVPLTVVNKPANISQGAPLKQLVWEPQINPLNFMNDMKYTVTITGVTGATKDTYTYQVTIIPVTPSYKKASPDDLGERIFMSVSR
jgi:uncharacterized protein YkwD